MPMKNFHLFSNLADKSDTIANELVVWFEGRFFVVTNVNDSVNYVGCEHLVLNLAPAPRK